MKSGGTTRPGQRTWIPLAGATALVAGLIAVQSPALAVALASMALLAFVTFFAPNMATYAVVFILYSNLAAIGVQFHGVPKIVAAAFPLLLGIPLARELFLRRRPLVVTPVLILLVLFFCVQAIGMAFSREIPRSSDALITLLLEGVVLYLLITNVIRTTAVLRGATWALLAAGVLMSAVPIYQQLTRSFDDNFGGLAQVEGIGFATGAVSDEGGLVRQARLAGPIGEKNRYAQVMLLLVPLGLMRFWGERDKRLRLAALACTGLISIAFVLPFSRGGAAGLVCMVGVMVMMRIIDMRRLLFVGFGVGLLLVAMPQYWSRLSTIGSAANVFSDEAEAGSNPDSAVKRRVVEMLAAVNVFIDHPLVGVGPGMFKTYAMEYGNEIGALRRIEGARRAHSLFLEIAAENGALGLALFLLMLFVSLAGLAKARRMLLQRDPELANLCTGYLLALVAYIATGVFLHLAYMRYFYLLLALAGSASYLAERAVMGEAKETQRLGGAPRVATSGESG